MFRRMYQARGRYNPCSIDDDNDDADDDDDVVKCSLYGSRLTQSVGAQCDVLYTPMRTGIVAEH
jgi:hypothetical protein